MPPHRTPKKTGAGDVAPSPKTSVRSASPSTPNGTSGGGITKRRRTKGDEKLTKFTHVLPTAAQIANNGRQGGRNLITWSRPRMAEKLLLNLVYECNRHGIDIPWDAVAHRFHPGSSGGAIQQHLARIRPSLIAEGHLVPPPTAKPGTTRVGVDPTIRGYIRANNDDPSKALETRPVYYDEPVENRRYNLPDAMDVVSGGQFEAPIKAERVADGVPTTPAAAQIPLKRAKSTNAKSTKRGRATSRKAKEDVFIKTEYFDSDEYDPEAEGNFKGRGRPKRAAAAAVKKYVEPTEDEFLSDPEDHIESVGPTLKSIEGCGKKETVNKNEVISKTMADDKNGDDATVVNNTTPPFTIPKNQPFADLDRDGEGEVEFPAMHPAYLAHARQNGFVSSFSGSQNPQTGMGNGIMDFAMNSHNNGTSYDSTGGWGGLPPASTARASSSDPFMVAPLSSSGPAFSRGGKSPEISFEFTEFLRDTDDES